MIGLIYAGCCSLKVKIFSTLANRITAFRLVMLPFCVYFHYAGYYTLSYWLVLVVIFFDALDGYIARLLGEESEFGEKFDPVTDKISMAVLFSIPILALRNIISDNLWTAIMARVVLLFTIEVLLLTIGLYGVIKKFKGGASNIFGKCKMITECFIYIGSYYLLFLAPGVFNPEQIAAIIDLLLSCAICFAALSLILHGYDFSKDKNSAF